MVKKVDEGVWDRIRERQQENIVAIDEVNKLLEKYDRNEDVLRILASFVRDKVGEDSPKEVNWIPLSSGKRPDVNGFHGDRRYVLLGRWYDDKWWTWCGWYTPYEGYGTEGFYDEAPFEYIINKEDLKDEGVDFIISDAGGEATHWAYFPEGPNND